MVAQARPKMPCIYTSIIAVNCHALVRKIGGWYGLRNHNYISRGCPRLALAHTVM